MMPRVTKSRLATDEEAENVGWADHTNTGVDTTFCCPHCYQNVEFNSPTYIQSDLQTKVVTCPVCNHDFLVWLDDQPVCCSARLPTIGE